LSVAFGDKQIEKPTQLSDATYNALTAKPNTSTKDQHAAADAAK